MKVYKSIDDYTNSKDAILTIGTFDGVHLGHAFVPVLAVAVQPSQPGQRWVSHCL